MRNGIDISGFSEIVEEVTSNPRQAQFRYAAEAKWTRSGGVLARVNPARIGTLRAPRVFEIPINPVPASRTSVALPNATPDELALVALSGCFLVSVVSSLSVQRCAIESIEMETALDIDPALARPVATSLDIRSRTDKGLAPTVEAAEMVKKVSPNYRSFSESLALRCRVGDQMYDFDPIDAHDEHADSFDPFASLNCKWSYGTQLRAELRRPGRAANLFPIDQPKQLGGVDWAPNPQEYLLMAIAGDVLNGLLARPGLSDAADEIIVSASARVDIRGMCGVEGVPVHLQDVEIEVSSPDGNCALDEEIRAGVRPVIEKSRICYLMRRAMRLEALTIN